MARNKSGSVSITISAALSLEELADVLVDELTTDSLMELISQIEQRTDDDDFAANLKKYLDEVATG